MNSVCVRRAPCAFITSLPHNDVTTLIEMCVVMLLAVVVSKELFQGSDAGDATVRVEMLCDGTVCCAADLALAHVYSSLFSSPTTLLTPHTDDAAALLSFE